MKKRMFSIVIILLFPSFLFVSLLNYYVQRDAIKDELINSSLPLVRDYIYDHISDNLEGPILTSRLMARDTFLVNWAIAGELDISEIQNYLRTIKTDHDLSSTFFVSAMTNQYYSYEGVHKTISEGDPHDTWYYDFVNSGNAIAFDVDSDEVLNGTLTIFINVRVVDDQGTFLGVTGVGIEMTDISSLLAETQVVYGRDIFMIDSAGLIQAHSDFSKIEKTSIYDMEGLQNIAATLLSSIEGTISDEYVVQRGTVIFTAKYLENIDWFIVVQQDLENSLRLARKNLLISILIGVTVSIIITLLSMAILKTYQKEVTKLTITDHLTGAFNRLYIESILLQEIGRGKRYKYPLAIFMIDLDQFKEINDSFGHDVGDTILKQFVTLFKDHLRQTDIFARWGGDEFIAVLPHTNRQEARLLANRCLKLVRAANYSNNIALRISIGATTILETDTPQSLVNRADEALYYVKKHGKNSYHFLSISE